MTKHLDEINKGEFMENTKKTNEQGNTGTGNQATGVKQAEDRGQNQPAKTSGESAFNNTANTATEAVDQAKQVVTDAYNRASKSLNESYSQAMDYGRENPGKTTLIAFGAGIGIGLLLAGNLGSSRNSRTGRIVPPVMNALTEIAREVFR
jgi:ElaB/YqjD/DUF883 family membrane-anchored ribosome-binding protein